MAFIIADRVRETSTTTGLGNLTLASAQPGAQRFGARMAVGDTTWYAITGPGGSWETGVGTYVAANTLERTTPLESSNGDARVNFAAGTKDVFVSIPAKVAQTFYRSDTVPLATNAEMDAGSETGPRIPSPAGIHRAARAERGLISRTTYSGAAAALVTNLGAYRRLRLSGRFFPSTAGRIYLQLSTDNGASFVGGTDNIWQILANQGTAVAASAGATALFPLSGDVPVPADPNQAVTFDLTIDLTPGAFPRLVGQGGLSNAGNENGHTVTGRINTVAAVNAFRILPAAGTMSGFLNVEGIRT